MWRFQWTIHRHVLAGAGLVVGLAWLLLELKLGAGLRRASYDLLFVLRPTIPVDQAAIVYLDEESHLELRQPLNAAWDRRLHARLIDRLRKAGARAIVFDIVFLESGRGDAEADGMLAASAKASGNVIVGANPRRDKSQDDGIGVDLPYDALRDAIDDRWGVVGMDPDADQIMRLHPRSYPPFKHSLSWATALFLGAPVTQGTNEAALEALERSDRWLNYYGPGKSFAHCSYSAALDADRVPDVLFKDRVVFVGAGTLTKFSGERKDAYISPFSLWERDAGRLMIAGVEVQATSTLNLLRGDWLTRAPVRMEWWSTILIALAVGTGLPKLRPTVATLTALLALAAVIGIAWALFVVARVWTAWLIPVVLVLVAWLYSIAANSIRLYVQNRLLEQSLGLHVSPKLVRKLMREGGGKFLRPGAEKHELTIFFSDIAGFTTISEGLDSDELAHMMNEYFQNAVGHCIHPTDGTVVKYIGDAIFSFWNAPEPQADHAERACEAALRFREIKLMEVRGKPLITRIGLHSGVANVGNFGSTTRVDYTALGENINLASRMEGLNKYLGTQTLLTGETQSRVGTHFVTRFLGRFILKGFERSVAVHELVGRAGKTTLSEGHHVFANALQDFHARRWTEAEAGFARVLELAPQDGPTHFYRKTLPELIENPPAADWDGAVELAEK